MNNSQVSDNQSSFTDIAAQVIEEAIQHLSQKTGLNNSRCKMLLNSSLTQTNKLRFIERSQPILTDNEADFISDLYAL